MLSFSAKLDPLLQYYLLNLDLYYTSIDRIGSRIWFTDIKKTKKKTVVVIGGLVRCFEN